MRANFVRENHIGDTRKRLQTGDTYEVTGTNNISGTGDLFVRNKRTGREERCDSKDWNDPRQHSSIITESKEHFTRGGDPYRKLGIGSSAPWRQDDQIRLKEDISWVPALNKDGGYWFRAVDLHHPKVTGFSYFNVKAAEHLWKAGDVLFYNSPTNEFLKKGDRTETFIDAEYIDNSPDVYERLYRTDEAESFTRGGDPYKKLGIGTRKDWDIKIYDASELVEHIGRRGLTENEMQAFTVEWLGLGGYMGRVELTAPDSNVQVWTTLKMKDRKAEDLERNWTELPYTICIHRGGYYMWEKKKEPVQLK